MSFAENLQFLRKREKITQEELAEELEVSRQSVSKWETGEAFPETEKLIVLCDRFDVNMDDLVRGDVEGAAAQKSRSPQDISGDTDGDDADKVYADDIGFSAHMDKFSMRISAGVFMIILGVAFLLTFIAAGNIAGGAYVNLFTALGLVALLLPVGAAVFVFIVSGMEHSEFVRRNKEVKNYFTTEQRAAFNKKFSIGVAVSVGVIIAAVTGLTVTYTVLDSFVFSSENLKNFASVMPVAAFMFIIAFCVAALCFLSIRHSKYDVAEYNKMNKNHGNKSVREKIKDGIQSAIMLIATAVFLIVGFVWNIWHPTWVVYPVGGLLCALVGVLFDIHK